MIAVENARPASMGLRMTSFIAAVHILLAINRSSTMNVPEAEKIATGLIPKREEPIKPNVPKASVADVLTSPAKNLPPAGMQIVEGHMIQSKVAFDVVCKRIEKSRDRGAVVHFEDGETDDFWHNGLAALDGAIPCFVLTRGGYWIVRKEVTKRIWAAYKDKFFPQGPKVPEILAIHGDNAKDLGTWDSIDGEGIIPDEELGEMRAASLLLEADPNYIAEVTCAESALLKLMKDEPHTTLVVKAAPTGLAQLIMQVPDYANRITIVWTAAVAIRQDGGFTPRFNYRRDLEAGDKLLALGVPIILLSPALSLTETLAIVDKEHAPIYKKYSRRPLASPGFDQLKKFTTAENVIAKILDRPLLNFMNKKMARSVTELQTLQQEEEHSLEKVTAISKERDDILKQIQEIKNIEQPIIIAELNKQLATVSENLGHFTRQLQTAMTKKKAHVARGMRWKTITEKDVHDGSYRDICSVDQLAHIVMVKELRDSSVKSVMQVRLKRELDQDELLVTAHLETNGPVFICTKVDPAPLSGKLQEFIHSVLTEEPKPSVEADRASVIQLGGMEKHVNKKQKPESPALVPTSLKEEFQMGRNDELKRNYA